MALTGTEFPQRLRAIRKAAGLTGFQLAEMVGINRTTLANLERGNRGPSVEVLSQLAKALQVPTDYLLGLPNWQAPVPQWVSDLLPDLAALDRSGQAAVRALVKGLKK